MTADDILSVELDVGRETGKFAIRQLPGIGVEEEGDGDKDGVVAESGGVGGGELVCKGDLVFSKRSDGFEGEQFAVERKRLVVPGEMASDLKERQVVTNQS